MILQDISGSMSYLNAQKLSIAAVKDFAESAPATDQLGLVDFNTDAFIDIDLRNVNSFLKAFNDLTLTKKLAPKRGTALFDAISVSAAYLQKTPQEGDSLFIISDGSDNVSTITGAKLRERLLPAKIRIYLFMLTGSTIPTELPPRLEIADLVRDSGGILVGATPLNKVSLQHLTSGMVEPVYDASPESLGRIQQQIQMLHNLIETAYRVEFDLDAPLVKQTELDAKLMSANSKPAEGLRLFCPRYINPN